MSKSHRVTSAQRWKRWWISPVKREVSAFISFSFISLHFIHVPSASVCSRKQQTKAAPAGAGKNNNPLLFVQERRSQISFGTRTRRPSVRSRSPGTGFWSGAACKSTVSCRTTLACFSASPAIWRERSRQTPTWLLQVGPLEDSSKLSAHLPLNSALLPSLPF